MELCFLKPAVENYSSKFLDKLASSFSIAAKEMLTICNGNSIYDLGFSHPEIIKRITNLLPEVDYFIVKHKYSQSTEIEEKNIHFITESEISNARGIILSNKLFSMLPFHVVVRDGEPKEVYVTFDGEKFGESLVALEEGEDGEELKEYLQRVDDPRTRLEVPIEAIRLLKSLGERLSSGFVVTFDYLLDPSELKDAERASGTITCHNHTIYTHNPYLNPGKLVIRASINLSALIEFGEDADLKVTGLTNYSHLLKSTTGFDEFSAELEKVSSKYRDSKLGTVKILIQQKGLRNPVLRSLRHVPQFGFWEKYNLPAEEETEILPEG